MNTSYQAVIFDMDGLLLDSERPIQDAWIRVCAAHGIALDAATYRQVVGLNARDSRAHLHRILGERLAVEDGIRLVDEDLASGFADAGYPLKPGARRLIEHIRARGIPCGLASSTGRTEIESRLRKAGVLHHFGAIASGDEVSRGKPDPEIYRLARSRLGLDAQARCLVFEDSEPGARAALAAGMHVVAVPDLRVPGAEVLQQCLAVLGSLEEAWPACEEWFGGVPADVAAR